MAEEPLVSVIVALYNKERYIARALRSALNQTFSDFELIVVDDGSTDRSASLVEMVRDERVRLIRGSHAGPGAARNRALREARAPFAAFLDADDEWLPTFLVSALNVLKRAPSDVAGITFACEFEPKWKDRTRRCIDWGLRHGTHRITASWKPLLVLALLEYLMLSATVAKTEVLRRWNGFYDRNHCLYAEDTHLWLKVLFNNAFITDGRRLARVYVDASELSANLARCRPVEPFLIDDRDVLKACPPHLVDLLTSLIKLRALKTACVLGYWGKRTEAAEIFTRYCTARDFRLRHFFQAALLSSPLGPAIGAIARIAAR